MNKNEVIELGNYILNVNPITNNLYGKIYFAKDNKGNKYAVKKINLSEFQNITIKNEFIKEIKMSYKLNNIHIVKLLDVVKSKKNIYCFFEYCDGQTLQSFCDNYISKFSQLIPFHIIQKFSKEIIEGLSYMSRKKCVYRNLKLENIMLSSNSKKKYEENEYLKNLFLQENILDDIIVKESTNVQYQENILKKEKNFEKITQLLDNYTIKLIDLSIGKDLSKENDLKTFCGNPLTIAPEIWGLKLGKNKNYNDKSDLWSLGVLLYYFAFNTFPFNGDSHMNIYNNIINGDYIIKKRNQLTIEFVDLICGLLKNNVNLRYDYNILINHPFFTKQFDELKPFIFKDDENEILLNANSDKKFLNKINISKKNIEEPNETLDDEYKDKFINRIFFTDCEIIDFIVNSKESEKDWIVIELNENL